MVAKIQIIYINIFVLGIFIIKKQNMITAYSQVFQEWPLSIEYRKT